MGLPGAQESPAKGGGSGLPATIPELSQRIVAR